MSKKIKFSIQGNDLIDIPNAAKKHIPEWYRDAERFVGGNMKIGNGTSNHGLNLGQSYSGDLDQIQLKKDLE